MVIIWGIHSWRVKIHFWQILNGQLVALEIYSTDIITKGYFDSLLFVIHFVNMKLLVFKLYL
jgi:hypothetical protein